MAASQLDRLRSGHRAYLKSVGSFVPKLAQKAFEKYGFSTVALLTDWSAIVGPEFGQYTRPERLKWPRRVAAYRDTEAADKGRPGATLVLRVDPARALEVQYGAAQLVERINNYFGYNAVADIRLLQAPIEAGATIAGTGADPVISRGPSGDGKLSHLGGEASSDNQPLDERLRDALGRLQATFQSDRGAS